MKVMFDPSIGATMSYRCASHATKQASKELPKKAEGYSNEQIYNAIMSFKNGISRIFGKPVSNTQTLNTIA